MVLFSTTEPTDQAKPVVKPVQSARYHPHHVVNTQWSVQTERDDLLEIIKQIVCSPEQGAKVLNTHAYAERALLVCSTP